MDIDVLKDAYLAKHWQSISDEAREHLTRFAAFARENRRPDEPVATETVTYADGATATGMPPLPEQSPAEQPAEPSIEGPAAEPAA